MRVAAIVFFAILLATGIPADDSSSVDLKLVLAADVSYSMDAADQRVQRFGYVRAFRDAEIVSAIGKGPRGRIAVTYVEWGGSAVQVLPWTIIGDAGSANRFAEELSRQPLRRIPFTSISNALAFGRELIRTNGLVTRKTNAPSPPTTHR